MGARAREVRKHAAPRFRATRLAEEEKVFLRAHARYEGSSLHKRNPGDSGLDPPASPRPDKTLCDEAGVFHRAEADGLLSEAIEAGLVSDHFVERFPKRLWVVARGQVFEAMHGNAGRYHGYPVRRSEPTYDAVVGVLGKP